MALVALAFPPTAPARDTGSTGQDLPVVQGQFTITNNTPYPITYLARWGDRGFWDKVVLAPGNTVIHYCPLDQNLRAPTPHVQFRRRLIGGRVETKTYRMGFYAVSSGMTGTDGTPKPYSFSYSDVGVVDLFAS
jgi:hypothetical protein